jgi:hypothetical protein
MINQTGRLSQSAEEIKTKAKLDVAAPLDYNKMLFQLKAFIALIKILFGEESIKASNLKAFVHLIKSQSILYKGRLALDNFFPLKVLQTVHN